MGLRFVACSTRFVVRSRPTAARPSEVYFNVIENGDRGCAKSNASGVLQVYFLENVFIVSLIKDS